MLERWIQREAAPAPCSLPAPAMAEWGSIGWRTRFAATIGSTPRRLGEIGALRRKEQQERRDQKQGRKRAFDTECEEATFYQGSSSDDEN